MATQQSIPQLVGQSKLAVVPLPAPQSGMRSVISIVKA